MTQSFTLGEPYKSEAEALKSKRNALLGLCAVVAFQAVVGLFFWWTSMHSMSGIFRPTHDQIPLFILAVILYFSNSRIAATIVVGMAVLNLVSWLPHAVSTGNFAPPGISILFAFVAGSVALSVFKTHAWHKENNKKLPRSKGVKWTLVGVLILILAGFFVPIAHFWNHTTNEVTLTERGDVIEYYEPLDKYRFEFPKTWNIDQLPLEYGNVILSPSDSQDVTVLIERWQPWNIAPVALFNGDAFLKMAQDEAATYSLENKLTVESVEMVGPKNINEARVIYTRTDGSKRYVYYIYDRAWRRQTSDAAHFFWRITAVVPSGSEQYDEAVRVILSSFVINQKGL